MNTHGDYFYRQACVSHALNFFFIALCFPGVTTCGVTISARPYVYKYTAGRLNALNLLGRTQLKQLQLVHNLGAYQLMY
jgi:hypothetical protein